MVTLFFAARHFPPLHLKCCAINTIAHVEHRKMSSADIFRLVEIRLKSSLLTRILDVIDYCIYNYQQIKQSTGKEEKYSEGEGCKNKFIDAKATYLHIKRNVYASKRI